MDCFKNLPTLCSGKDVQFQLICCSTYEHRFEPKKMDVEIPHSSKKDEIDGEEEKTFKRFQKYFCCHKSITTYE